MRRSGSVLICLFLIGVVVLGGCTTVSYYSQSVVGHSRIMLARQPLDEVIPGASEPLRSQLQLAQTLKRFAVTELGLPQTRSYEHYVDLERAFPVWNVVAAEEFSMEAKQWCYLVIGCAAYRGYFEEARAVAYAESLHNKGFETWVGGATAYSTLGWFADPILPSMLRYGDAAFAETLFHEMAHQRLYINGDSAFNEAFATLVGEEGTRRWLKANRPLELDDYQRRLTAIDEFGALVERTKQQLTLLYSQPASDDDKRRKKHAEIAAFYDAYDHLKTERWGGKPWFEHWFSTPVNNARLAAFSTYRNRLPALSHLLAQCDHDLTRFYQRVADSALDGDTVVIPTACEINPDEETNESS